MKSIKDILMESFRALLVPQELVCMKCLRPDDEVLDDAGDFSCCERCSESITSKTGKTVRARWEPSRKGG